MKHLYTIFLFLLIGMSTLNAQTVNVYGVVKDDSGEGVIGATILVEGTTTGVMSSLDGAFSINVPSNNSVLLVSFLGYDTEKVPVVVGSEMTIVLKSSSQIIEDIVITGMTATDKRMFTGAADRLNADDMKISGVADISRSLEGRSAGVSVQNVSGTFGTAPKIQIRGATSIYGNSKPLWVVDGVIIEDVTDISADQLSSGDAVTLIGNAIAGLNADDIESFDILKDGSATSIYGARAMAGVIVVTTKRGKAGVTSINYTGEFSTRLIPSYRNFNIMNSQDQMGVYRELERKGWLNYASTYRAAESGIYGQMYRLIHYYDPSTGQFGLPNTTEAKNAYLRQGEMRNTDWFQELFSNSITQTHSVSIASGSERSNSYVSMSALDDPGWYKQSKVERYTLNANAQFKILPNLTFTLLGNAAYRKQFAPGTVGRQMDVVSGEVSRDFDINPYSYALNTTRTMGANDSFIRNYTDFNIMQELDQNYIEYDIVEARFQGELKWNVIPGLDLAVLGATKYQTSSMQHHIKDESNYARAHREMSDATIRDNNPWLYTDPDQPNSLPITILPNGGFYEKREFKMKSYDFRATANYKKTFNRDHYIDLFAGTEINQVQRTSDWFRGVGMQYDKGEMPFFSYLAFKKYREQNTNYYGLDNRLGRSVSFFGMASYSYQGKYSITGTGRYEGSNRLGRSRQARWLPTWNIALAWNVHEEDFFHAQNVISHLKFRTSFSLTADMPADVSNSRVIINNYNPWRPGASNGETGLGIYALENSELTYEKKYEYNFGMDIGFLNNRLNVSVDAYARQMFDQLGFVATQGTGGIINQLANAAEFKSHGVETTISSRNIENTNFRWRTDFTFSYAANKITNLLSNSTLLSFIQGGGFAMAGYPRGALFSIPFTGLDSEGFPTFEWSNGKQITVDNYSDIDFQQRTDLDFLVYEGTTEPKFTGGLGNVFSYKNFHLNIFMTYSFGNKIRLYPHFKSSYSDTDAIPKDFKNRWMMPGDEKYTDIPVIASARQSNKYGNYLDFGYNAYNYSTARIADGGFIRMKEISLTYDFPRELVQKMKMSNFSLKLQVTNPFLIYSDKKLNGEDPEFFRSGGVSSPLAQQFTLTVRLGF